MDKAQLKQRVCEAIKARRADIEALAAAIAAELNEKGRVTLRAQGSDALERAISSVNLAKACMPDHSISLGKAVSYSGNVTMVFNAIKNGIL